MCSTHALENTHISMGMLVPNIEMSEINLNWEWLNSHLESKGRPETIVILDCGLEIKKEVTSVCRSRFPFESLCERAGTL